MDASDLYMVFASKVTSSTPQACVSWHYFEGSVSSFQSQKPAEALSSVRTQLAVLHFCHYVSVQRLLDHIVNTENGDESICSGLQRLDLDLNMAGKSLCFVSVYSQFCRGW